MGLALLNPPGFVFYKCGFGQVSTSLLDIGKTSVAQAFDAVKAEADRAGVEIVGAEIVGLVPRAALDRSAAYFSRVENFREDLVLENLVESTKKDSK